MGPGNPPRHSKDAEEPVTLDLDPRDYVSSKNEELPREERPSDEAASHGGDRVEQGDTGNKPFDAADTQPASSTRPVDEPPVHDPLPAPKGAAVSSLIASGIVGGLIALLAAGAIQYAVGPRGGKEDGRTTQLSADIEGLKQSVANLAAASGDRGGQDALEKRLAALESASQNRKPDPAADGKLAELAGQVEQLRAMLAQSQQQQSQTQATIGGRLDAAEKKLNEPRQDVAVAKAVAAAALKAAIDRGSGFQAELDTYAQVAPDDPAVGELRAFAQTGVPSRAELVRQTPAVATAIIEAAHRPDPQAGWSTRLFASAQTLVKVRPVGAIEGDTVEAIASRMEDKIRNGDLQGAVGEWDSLPEPSKQASAAFKQSLEARMHVEDLVGQTLSRAVSETGKEG